MGNCQAIEAATVVIQYPGGGVERLYRRVLAGKVMDLNPGHYVAAVVPLLSSAGVPEKHLKLLRPNDTLHVGHVYQLTSFEDVVKDFVEKDEKKLSKLILTQRQRSSSKDKKKGVDCAGQGDEISKTEEGVVEVHDECRMGMVVERQSQWKPALKSIQEVQD